MTVMTFILILAAVIAATLLAGAMMMYRSMYMATRGKRIAGYPNPRKALVVLDIQEGYSGTATRQPVTAPPSTGMIATVNRLITMAAETGMEVAYVRQVFSNNLFVRLHGGRRQGQVVIDRRITLINGNDFAKNRTDAFSNRQFEQFLIDRQVGELYLVGVDAAFCVYYTALGALNRGYMVTIVQDAVRSSKSLADVLERYRRSGIGVLTSEQLIGSSPRS